MTEPEITWAEVMRSENERRASEPADTVSPNGDARDQANRTESTVEPHLPAAPDYPAEVLYGPLADLVKAGKSTGLPPALTGGAGLGALSAATGPADMEVHGKGWIERAALWIPLLAPRGGKKTPSQTLAWQPLRDLDADTHRVYRAAADRWASLPPAHRRETPKPADPTLLLDDTTLEAVARHLAAGDGTGGLDVDELRGWLANLGRYRAGGADGGDRGRWLAMWSTGPWRYRRVGADVDLLVRRPVLTICGTLQTGLHPLLGGEQDGFRPRWLPHLAALDTTGDLGAWQPALAYDTAIEKLYKTRARRQWTLAGKAHALWLGARRRWKNESAGTESPSTAGALVKADMQAARVALVLAESTDPGLGGDLPVEAMTCAVSIVDYAMDVWRALPEGDVLTLSRKDELLQRGAERLAEWLDQHGGRATKRELLRAAAGGARTADDLNAMLGRYEALYPGSLRSEQPPRGPVTLAVYAPVRLPSNRNFDTVSADSVMDSRGSVPAGKNAGQRTSGATVSTVDPTADSSGSADSAGNGRAADDDSAALRLVEDMLGGTIVTPPGDGR